MHRFRFFVPLLVCACVCVCVCVVSSFVVSPFPGLCRHLFLLCVGPCLACFGVDQFAHCGIIAFAQRRIAELIISTKRKRRTLKSRATSWVGCGVASSQVGEGLMHRFYFFVPLLVCVCNASLA